MSQTVLTLTPEFGGSRFGPFTGGTLSIGTDAARCQVALHPSTGAMPVHGLLTDLGQRWQIQPAVAGAALFVRKANGRIVPVTTAVQVDPGDAIVVGSQSGPTLLVSRVAEARGPGPAAGRPGGPKIAGSQHFTQDRWTREIYRQVELFLVTLPGGREIYRAWTYYKTGALFRPRYIIGAVVGLFGLFGVGCLSCFGAIGAFFGLTAGG
jgi:hypothetical protein